MQLKNNKNRKRILISLIILALIGLLCWLMLGRSSQHNGMGAPLTATIGRGDIQKTVLATGVIKPSVQVNVGAQVTGQVKKIYVQQGDRVKKGQLLAEIDPSIQQNELHNAEAQLRSSLAQRQSTLATLKQYELAYKRQLQLDRENAGVKSELESARAQYEAQKEQLRVNDSQVEQSRTAVEKARTNLGYTQIVAPVDGEVLGIVTKEGQTVVSSQVAPTILVLANLDMMTVHTRISETDILKVKVGQPLWFYVVADPKRRYESVMGEIQEAPDDALQEQGSGSAAGNRQQSAIYYNGTFNISNYQRYLKTSMTAQIFIITDEVKNVLRVPVAAFGLTKGTDQVQVNVLNGNKIEPRWIRIGLNDRLYAEVKQGLKEGDKVVIAQAGGVRHG